MSVEWIKDAMVPKDLRTHCPLCGGMFGLPHRRTEEHIFPSWLQEAFGLHNKRLNLANFIDKRYRSVKVDICRPCNNETFSRIEGRLAPVLTASDAYEAARDVGDDELAIWIGKIFWLLLRKSNAALDHRTRDDEAPDTIIPQALLPGTLYLGLFEHAFANGICMETRYLDGPNEPGAFDRPFSLYRVRIDVRDDKAEAFDFIDDPHVLGAAIRLGSLGLICIFDGGLHRRFRSPHFPYLETERHHPVQFGEAVACALYDGTVLDPSARAFTAFWDAGHSRVIARNDIPSWFNPYMEENHDPRRLADCIGRIVGLDPASVLDDRGVIRSSILDPDGGFARYPVTAEERAVLERDPRWRYADRDARWRTTEHGPGRSDTVSPRLAIHPPP